MALHVSQKSQHQWVMGTIDWEADYMLQLLPSRVTSSLRFGSTICNRVEVRCDGLLSQIKETVPFVLGGIAGK